MLDKREPDTNIKKLDDISLLELLCKTNDDIAYNEFIKRFYAKILEQCKHKCEIRKIDSHVGIQIASDVFERVRKYKSFDKSKLKSENKNKAITAWLYRILTHLFYDYHNSNKNVNITVNSYFDDIANSVSKETNAENLAFKRDLAKVIYNKLNKKEQTVVLTDLEHKRGQKYLPDDVTETLAKNLGVKKPTIRKIRERAIQKIKLALDEINNK
ncbi:sigma-70 family RNA polymerase sigma factor [Aureibaculum sp. 2210JD6-5]|uniref:RNA polymerase sigma factor n=1 Tax=Aureibaculum sp. 2210JD6-5 TaxID=3103957 RepID=UPI002AAD529B|nr:sigma-70 family RNA polymerase sigma factor [Aureibaculum sp. 2210JD6-5]MDY7396976.1 sigma-70 family RNA polymerase sigma factor [Aureibaculum sp. 2210JD6-5]